MTKPLDVGKVLVERLKRFTENMETKLMTKPIILTDKEIEAIEAAIDRFRDWVNGFDDDERATILRSLLERIKDK